MPGVPRSESLTIPIVDFVDFGDGTSEVSYPYFWKLVNNNSQLTQKAKEIGREFFKACREVGFAYLVNTGIPKDKVDEMFEWVRSTCTLLQFHALTNDAFVVLQVLLIASGGQEQSSTPP
jgi:hypothetical protein